MATSNEREELYDRFVKCFTGHGILVTENPSDLLRASIVDAFKLLEADRAQLIQRIDKEVKALSTLGGLAKELIDRDEVRALLATYKEKK